MKQSSLSLSRLMGAFSTLLMLAAVVTGCSRSVAHDIQPNPTTPLRNVNLYLTDAPADFQHVYFDIQKIEVKVDLDQTHANDDSFGDNDDDYDDTEEVDQFGRWVTLNVAPQQLDVLALRNGVERLMGNAAVPTRIRKVRITVGDENRLINGEGRDCRLALINDTEHLLYVRVKAADMDNSLPGTTELRLDVDLARSIVAAGDEYVLTPQMRLFNLQTTGAVSGNISPTDAGARVMITDGLGFETGAIPAPQEGMFLVRGLRPGVVYTVMVTAPGYNDYEIRDVMVERGGELQLGEITLR
ncbi:MAG: hypothetical protein RLZZ256_710 [Bacteroidota bacterium]|jgi:hypothetical protein